MITNTRKAVLVTGASTGIGEACALHLDGLGYQVFAGVRREEDGEALRRKASQPASCLTPVYLDVTDPEMVSRSVRQIESESGPDGLYGLVNNAGVAVASPVEFLPLEDLRWQLEVNVIGQVAVIQACLPLLRKSKGRIINISSISGRVASPFLSPYSSSKFALEAISDSLRVELRPWKISVIVIEPGSIYTPIWEKSLKTAQQLIQRLPPAAFELYGGAMENAIKTLYGTGEAGKPVSVVTQVVAQALAASRPRARYPVGFSIQLAILLAVLAPTRWRDRYMASRFGIP